MLKPGDHATAERNYSERDLQEFCGLAGVPPADVRQIPEPLIAAMFSDLLGTQLPGRGSMYLKQSLHYLCPPPIGEPLEARVEVIRLRPEKALVDLRTTCVTGDGKLVAKGVALVMYPPIGEP